MSINHASTSQVEFTINDETISNISLLKQYLNKHLPLQATLPCMDQNYASFGIDFLELISQKANGFENKNTISPNAQHLTCMIDNSALEIQYFPEGAALIAWFNTYGNIYYFVNDINKWTSATQYKEQREQSIDRSFAKEMLCQNRDTIIDIILYFYETAEKNPQYKWVEDFMYTGPECWHREWLKKLLLGSFCIPEEFNQDLKKLRKMQESGEWKWGTPWKRNDYWRGAVFWENSDEMNYLEYLTYLQSREYIELLQTEDGKSSTLLKIQDFESSAQIQHEKLLRKTASQLMTEKTFTKRESGIRNLSFLRNCTHLRELDLRCNDVEDLSPIASLHNLKELTLDFNLISDLSPLAELDQLRHLYLRRNKIHSLEPLQGMRSLNTLTLCNNPLEQGTLAWLRKCKRLGTLDLTSTGLQDISDLEYCRVWSLDLYGNPGLTGLEVITTMKNLCCLRLDWRTARQYDICRLVPRMTEYARYGDQIIYVWPEKFFDD